MKKSMRQKCGKKKKQQKKQRQIKGRRRSHGETLEHLDHINKTNRQRHLRGEESEMHRGEWLNKTQVWLIRQPIKQKGQQRTQDLKGNKRC